LVVQRVLSSRLTYRESQIIQVLCLEARNLLVAPSNRKQPPEIFNSSSTLDGLTKA